MKKIIIISAAVVFIILALVTYIVAGTNVSERLPQQLADERSSSFSIGDYLLRNKYNSSQLFETFPFDAYLDSTNVRNIRVIKSDLASLTAFSNDAGTSQRVISMALTSRLEPRLNRYLEPYDPDSLLTVVMWAERFQHYAEIDPDNEIFHESVYNYWMDKVSNQLAKFSAQKSSRKYDYKFKYLRSRCIENKFPPSIKVTGEEKAFNNLIYGHYGHLLNASWNQTSTLQKLIVLLFALLTLYGYFCIIKQHLIKRK